MRATRFHPISACALSAVALLTLGACSPSDREQVSSTASKAAQTARTETSKAAAGAEKALDDAAVTTKVKTALLADSQVKGTQINVDTDNGNVTLSGNSPPRARRCAPSSLRRTWKASRPSGTT